MRVGGRDDDDDNDYDDDDDDGLVTFNLQVYYI